MESDVENGAQNHDEHHPDLYSILTSCLPRSETGNIAMIAFVIPLPFALGLPHHSTYMIFGDEELDSLSERTWLVTDDGPALPDTEGRIGVSIRAWRPLKTDVVLHSLVSDMTRVFHSLCGSEAKGEVHLPDDEVAGTVLEASTLIYLKDGDEDDSAAVSAAFDRSMESMDLLLRALRITLDDPRIFPLGMMSMVPSIPFVVRYGDDLQNRFTGVFMVNIGKSMPTLRSAEVSEPLLAQVVERVRRAQRNFPTFATEDAFARAKRSFYAESDYAATTVFSYSAIEIFCNGLFSLLSWERGNPRSDVLNVLEGQGFESRMRRRFSPLLGGNWDFKSSSSPIHVLDSVATTRHRYLHAGIEPSMSDAARALDSYLDVTEFAKDRLVTRKFDYPRTALLILGEPGLRRKGAWTRRFRQQVDSIVDEEYWLETYSKWVNHVPT